MENTRILTIEQHDGPPEGTSDVLPCVCQRNITTFSKIRCVLSLPAITALQRLHHRHAIANQYNYNENSHSAHTRPTADPISLPKDPATHPGSLPLYHNQTEPVPGGAAIATGSVRTRLNHGLNMGSIVCACPCRPRRGWGVGYPPNLVSGRLCTSLGRIRSGVVTTGINSGVREAYLCFLEACYCTR